MKKLTTTLLLAAAVAASVTPAAFAASDEAKDAANALYEQGLFLGNGTTATGAPNFELDRKPTRHEAVTMLVRLLGKEEEAKNGTWNTPFTDVDEWAKPYVGYAYANNLTTGTSETTFSGNDTVTATEYLTLVLRVLGYDDKKGDFSWDKAWELSDKIGLTNGEYNASTKEFTRGDVAIISQKTVEKKAETDKKPEDDKKQEEDNPKDEEQNDNKTSKKDGSISDIEALILLDEEDERYRKIIAVLSQQKQDYYNRKDKEIWEIWKSGKAFENDYLAELDGLQQEAARLLNAYEQSSSPEEKAELYKQREEIVAEFNRREDYYWNNSKEINKLRNDIEKYNAIIDRQIEEEKDNHKKKVKEIHDKQY